MHGAQEDDSFSFVRYVAHHGHVIFESKFRAISLFCLDGCIIMGISGLFLRRVPTTVKSSASSFAANGMLVKKLSTVMFRPVETRLTF